RAGGELAADLVDRDGGVVALVRVDPDDHHGARLLSRGDTDRPVGTLQWGRGHAPVKPRRPVHIASRAAESGPSHSGSAAKSEPPRHTPSLTLKRSEASARDVQRATRARTS